MPGSGAPSEKKHFGSLLELDSSGVGGSHAQEVRGTPVETSRSSELLAFDVSVLNRADERGWAARKVGEELDGSKGLGHRVDVDGCTGRELIRDQVGEGQSGASDPAVELLERSGGLAIGKVEGRTEDGRLLSVQLVAVQGQGQASAHGHDQTCETERIESRSERAAAAASGIAPEIDALGLTEQDAVGEVDDGLIFAAAELQRQLGLPQLRETGWIELRGRGVVGQRDEGAAQAEGSRAWILEVTGGREENGLRTAAGGLRHQGRAKEKEDRAAGADSGDYHGRTSRSKRKLFLS